MARNNRQLRKNDHRNSVKLLQRPDNGLGAFADASVDAFLMFDENLNLLSINPAGEKLLSVSREADAGKNITEIVPDIKKTGRHEKYLSVIETGRPFFADDIIPHPRFGNKHLSIKAFKVWHGVGMIVNDITERKQVEAALRKQSHDLGERVKELGCIRAISDLASREYLSLNELFEDIVKVIPAGWQYPEITCARIVMEDQEFKTNNFKLTDWKQASNIVVQGKRAGAVEVYYLEERAGEDEGPFLKEERVLINIVAERLGRILERKKAEEALKESEERFRAIFENAVDGMVLADPETREFYTANRMFCQMLGYSLEEIKNMGIKDLHPEEALPYVGQQFEKQVRGEITLARDIPVKRKDGSIVYAEVNSSLMTVSGRSYIMGMFRDITERKKAEDALRRSEEYFRVLMENSLDAVTIMNEDGTIRYESPSYEHLLGFKPEERVGSGLLERIHPDDVTKVVELFAEFLQNRGGTLNTEVRAQHKDGSWRFIEAIGSNLLDNPVVKGIVINLRDITERKNAEEALRQSEQRYRLLADNVTDVIWTSDMNLRFTYFSPAIRHFRGYSVEEAMGLSLAETLSSASVEVAAKVFAEHMAAENMGRRDLSGPVTLELEHKCKNGGTVWGEVKMDFLRDLEGKPVGILGVARDITERRKMEEELRRLSDAVRMSTDSIVVTDMRGNILDGNEASVRMYGADNRADLMGMKAFDIIVPEDREKAYEKMKAVMEKGYVSGLEYHVLTRGGRKILVEASTALMKGSKGEPMGFVGVSRDITERKRAEEALRESEHKFRAIFDNANEGFISVDPESGKFFNPNRKMIEMLGYDSAGEIANLTVSDIHPEQDLPYILKEFGRHVKREISRSENIPVKRKDGSVFFASISSSPITIADTMCLSCIFTDITERKQAQEELRESEERFRTIFDNSVDGILVTDLETKSLYTCNKAMCQMLGYSLEEIRNLKVTDIHPKKDLPYIMTEIEREQQGGSPGVKVLPLKRKDGSVLYAEVTPSLVTFAGRHYLAGIFRDISERKRAEEALKSSEERYRLVVDNANEFILVAQDGMIKFFNSKVVGLLGYAREDLAFRPFTYFIHPDDRQMVMERYLERIGGGAPPPLYSFRVVDKTGNIRWVEISAVVFNWEGMPATLNFLTDITERKKAEEEKQRMEEQLLLAGRLAAVGELSAGVAHELNNPIAAIQGFAQLLTARNDLDETTKKDLSIIYREAQRAAKITQNLLSFARKHEPEKQLVSLNEVIEKTLELRAHQMKVNNIDMVVDFAADLPKTMADFFQMQQVFVNIINNAEQAMVEAHGKGRLVVKTQKVGDMIQISFADDGPGIPKENMKRIFDPFFTTKEVGKGTGLGLSICYGLVEAHGGRIYARSKLGEGATFVVEIPIVSEGQ